MPSLSTSRPSTGRRSLSSHRRAPTSRWTIPTAIVQTTYVYPPLTALAVIPFTALSIQTAGFLAMGALVLVALAIPWTLGVRDWRCFGMILLWPPVHMAIQTASVTILLAFGAALSWRLRDRSGWTSAVVGLTVATKLIMWPLVVWLLATRRTTAAVMSCLIAAALALGSWIPIRFAGLVDYPEILDRLQNAIELNCYTVYVLALDAGASTTTARAVWLAVGICLVAAVLALGRRGRDREAFVLTMAAALALSPIVWLHYFTLLIVVAAIAQPRLGPAWFPPLLLYAATGSGNPTPFQTALTLLAAAATIGLSLISLRRDPSSVSHDLSLRRAP